MSINLALADAANNCVREGALTTLTLRSGVEIVGKLQRVGPSDLGTVHIRHGNGGWTTVIVSEIGAVTSHRP